MRTKAYNQLLCVAVTVLFLERGHTQKEFGTINITHNDTAHHVTATAGFIVPNVNLKPTTTSSSSIPPVFGNGTLCGTTLSWCQCSVSEVSCQSSSYTWQLLPSDLRKLPSFLPTQKVRSLIIKDVVMRELDSEISDTFPALLRATVSTANVRIVSDQAFAGLGHLQQLSLANNHLLSLAAETFGGLRALQELDLGENLFSLLPPDLFHDLSDLVSLNLSNNRIQRLHPALFRGGAALSADDSLANNNTNSVNSKIEHIDLSFNELMFMPTGIFRGLVKLRTVNLRRNLLVTLNRVTFSLLPDLQSVHVSHNPYNCHCGMRWLADELRSASGSNPAQAVNSVAKFSRGSPFFGDRELIKCAHPDKFGNTPLVSVAAIDNTFSCTPPRATAVRQYPIASSPAYQRMEVVFACNVSGNPLPSVLWRLPLGDILMDPAQAHYAGDNWTETGAGLYLGYLVKDTNDRVAFRMRTLSRILFELRVSSLRGVSQGRYDCVAVNPYGVTEEGVQVDLISPVESMYFPSLFAGAAVAGVALLVGVVGGAISGCIDSCSCCDCCRDCRMSGSNLIYMRSDASAKETDLEQRLEEVESLSPSERGETAQPSSSWPTSGMFANGAYHSTLEDLSDDYNDESSDPMEMAPMEMALVGRAAAGQDTEFQEVDVELREMGVALRGSCVPLLGAGALGEDEKLLVESGELLTGLDLRLQELETQQEGGECTTSDSATATLSSKLGGWKTLESLESLRARLKARLEQMDLARERLKARMERRAGRMKVKMEQRAERVRTGIDKRKEKVRNKMATIRTYSSQSLQTIRETSSNYAHKLQSGMRTAVENMGNTVQSLKEFCGTGDPLGQTISVATIITDVDTEERVEMVRNVTMV